MLNVGVFGLDYACYWLLFHGFGWGLPLLAAVTVGVFIAAGSSLPSAAGHLGIHRAASVLAFRVYGVGETQTSAYSIVVQVLSLLVICMQGGAALFGYGLCFSDLSGAGTIKASRSGSRSLCYNSPVAPVRVGAVTAWPGRRLNLGRWHCQTTP